MYFALKGSNFNGNSFTEKALNQGAAFAVVDDADFVLNERCILVEDTLTALQSLATYHRRQLKNVKVLGLTGSNGKTTTKELIASVAATTLNTYATKGNLNNHIGVPVTLLNMPANTQFAVIEMGANHPGEIAQLCEIAQPNMALITNIGKAHLEGFGNIGGVMKAKGELFDYIDGLNGQVFLNMEDIRVAKLGYFFKNAIDYGTKSWYRVHAQITQSVPALSLVWYASQNHHRRHGTVTPTTVNTQLVGNYNFTNVLAAIALGIHLNVPPEQIVTAIEQYCPTNNRSEIRKIGTNTYILDAYNANPTSMEAAIRSFAAQNHPNKWLVLGDMFELGDQAKTEHSNIIQLLRELKLKNVVLVGNEFGKAKGKFLCEHFTSAVDAAQWMKTAPLLNNALILLKGSRGMHLETIITS